MSDQKLELILQAIKQVQVQVGGLSTDVGVLGERIDSLDQRMDKIEVRMDSLDQRMDKIEVRMDSLDQRMDKIEIRMDSLDQRMDKIEVRMDSLDQRMDKFETRMDKFEEDLTEIKVLVSDIPFIKQAALETQEHVKRLDERQLCFEKETKSTLNNHFISIDILNQRQLQLEATVQAL